MFSLGILVKTLKLALIFGNQNSLGSCLGYYHLHHITTQVLTGIWLHSYIYIKKFANTTTSLQGYTDGVL